MEQIALNSMDVNDGRKVPSKASQEKNSLLTDQSNLSASIWCPENYDFWIDLCMHDFRYNLILLPYSFYSVEQQSPVFIDAMISRHGALLKHFLLN